MLFLFICKEELGSWVTMINQDSLVVSRKAKKKQHVHTQTTWLPMCNLQLPMLWNLQALWALLLSYYRSSTFLACRISKSKMNKLGVTIVKNQPFMLPVSHLRLKLDHLKSYSIVTRKLVLFYAESANQNSLQLLQPPLLRGLQYSILWLKKSWLVATYFYFCKLRTPQYSIMNYDSGS